ncbi:50S ribosomal protein L11 methyltransferase [Candidatus Woesearchaeota archaeon]|nr:50S ribosomal protein L11 methyltransferase [Candidatus Woesearchaeota archaeon]
MEEIKLVLVSGSGKHLYVRNLNQDYHCQYGVIKKEDLKGVSGSGIVKTNKGVELPAFKPSFIDVFRKIRRAPQVIPAKDMGSIIAETGMGKDSVVVDAGTGSGALAIFMANIASKIITYEERQDFAKIAAENINLLKAKNVLLKNKNVYEGIDERNADVVTFDLPEPWKGVGAASAALKPGGFLVSYSPTIPQVCDMLTAAKEKGFIHVKTIEITEREWEIENRIVRPKSQTIGHSGFLTFLRKIK